jgi:hypothetical protein
MKLNRPLKFLAFLLSVIALSSVLSVTATTKNFSQSYPVVACPPTLDGLGSQISLSSKKTLFQRLQTRSTKTSQVSFLRLPVMKDSLVLTSEGVTPVIWQSRSGSWAGAALCSSSATSQWFVGGAADVTTKGRLIIVNSGLSDAVVDVESFTETGKQPMQTINVSSKNFIVISIDSLAPGDKILTVHVAPRSGRINAFMIDEQVKGLKALGGDLVNPAVTASKSVVIPAIPNQSSRNTPALPHTLRVLTPGDVDASITVEVLSGDGVFVPVGLNSRSVSAGVVTEFQLDPNITSKFMAIRISATEPVVAAVKSTVVVTGRKDFVWSTAAPELVPLTMAITGLDPAISFVGDNINVSIDLTLTNGKVVRQNVKGSDIANWRVPDNARSFTIVKVGTGTFAGALVSSVNGYGYFPIASGSLLTKIEVPDSNIRVLNP